MKILITKKQLQLIQEANVKKFDPKTETEEQKKERYNRVADMIYRYMENLNIFVIPGYRFLTKNKYGNFDRNMAAFLYQNLNRGEYDAFVKPLIKQKNDKITYTTEIKLGKKNYLIEPGMAVRSWGEVIVYNVFKMNGITLEYENPERSFIYALPGVKPKRFYKKIPDFYWETPNGGLYIEVAGFPSSHELQVNYGKKLEYAKKELEKIGGDMIILDYYLYIDKLVDFHKLVCEKFGFKYDPVDFITAIYYEGVDREQMRKEVNDLILTKVKTRGQQDRIRNIIMRILTKKGLEGDKEVGYEGVVDYKRETGVGLKWGDVEYRKRVQKAWCESSGSFRATAAKFKELFPSEGLSKNTVDFLVKNFKEEFPEDINKREEICKNYQNQP